MDAKTFLNSTTVLTPAMGGLAAIAGSRFGRRIAFAPDTGAGTGGDTAETKPEAKTADEEVTKTETKPSETKPEAKPEPKVSDEVAKLVKEVMKHKDKAKAAEGQAAEASAKLSGLTEKIQQIFGVEGLEEIETALTKAAQDEETRLKAAGEFDKLKDRIISEHTKEKNRLIGETNQKVGDLAKKLDSAEGEIRRLLVSNSFAASEYIASELTLAPSHAERLFGDHFKVEEKDGRRVVTAYLNGSPLTDAEGKPLAFDQALAEIVNTDPGKDKLFKPKAKPGAGSGATGLDSKIPQPDTKRGVSRIAAALNSH